MARDRTWLAVLFSTLAVLLPAASASATTFIVTKPTDTNDGACTASNCSLRDAIIASNAASGPNTISLHAGHYRLTLPGTNEHAAATGDLNITKSVTINGPGAASTTIDATGIDRIFEILSGANLTVSGVTLTGGIAVPFTPGTAAHGGAILDDAGGSVTVKGSTITNNRASATQGGYGGAIEALATSASIAVTNSTVNGNRAGGLAGTSDYGFGGAIDNYGTGVLTLTYVTMTGNHAGGGGAFGYGGAVYSLGPSATISRATISNNTAGGGGGSGYAYGGGVGVEAPTITDSTFRGNTAGGGGGSAFGYGGGVDSSGPATLTRSVVAGNRAGGGGDGTGTGAFGYGGGVDASASTVALTDSSVTGNSAGGGDAQSFGYGGGVNGSVTGLRSTVSGNTAGGGGGFAYGGGISGASDPTTLTNSTVSDNTAGGGSDATGYGHGGGIALFGAATLIYSDVVDNTAASSTLGSGGGVWGALTSRGSMLADNTATSGSNCSATATSLGHNLETGTSCGFAAAGDLLAEVMLGPLQNNGGLTPTRALLGGPAIDGGETSGCPATDQRGVVRPQGSACDIGAYEFAPPAVRTGPAKIGTKLRVTLAGTGSNPDVLAGSFYFQWGRTAAYGKQTPAGAFPALAVGRTFTAVVGKLAPGTLYHYRATVLNGDRTIVGADRTFATPAAPVLLMLALRPRTFSPQPGSGASVARASHHGAKVAYTDSQPGLTRFTVLRATRGYRLGSRCLAHRPKAQKHPRRCTRYAKLGSFSHRGLAGVNHLKFTGRVRRRPLRPGGYWLVAQAHNDFGALSRVIRESFRIVG
jgi:CSLREA domain-containing protein